MQDILTKIIDVAEIADETGNINLSKKLDTLASSLLQIKTAQYIGTQGYAVRNSRCWSNCYRQKRAQKPDMPAQVVWQTCHKEYVESMNNDGSKWDKYADSGAMTKIASINSSQIGVYHRKIAEMIDRELQNGASYSYAVQSSINNDFVYLSQQTLDAVASKLSKLAHQYTDDKKIYTKIQEIIDSIHSYQKNVSTKTAQAAPPAATPAPGAPAPAGAPAGTPAPAGAPGTAPSAAIPNFNEVINKISNIPNFKDEVAIKTTLNTLKTDLSAAKGDFDSIKDAINKYFNALKPLTISDANARALFNASNDAGLNRAQNVNAIMIAFNNIQRLFNDKIMKMR